MKKHMWWWIIGGIAFLYLGGFSIVSGLVSGVTGPATASKV
jgi:hypothetical protein